jgi:hypothetical protein
MTKTICYEKRIFLNAADVTITVAETTCRAMSLTKSDE